jgi:hypothetical protein
MALAALALGDERPDAVTDLSVGHRDLLLFDLRSRLFGDALDIATSCPSCSTSVELGLSSSAMLQALPPASTGRVSVGKRNLVLRSVTCADLAAMQGLDLAESRAFLARSCVATGQDVAGVRDEEDEQIVTAVAAELATMEPASDLQLVIDCPACATVWRDTFDVVDFLWLELDAWAYRILYDVQLLAGAYGWTEPDVLALPGWRRQYYAEALGA